MTALVERIGALRHCRPRARRARICRALAGDPAVELVVGGRDEPRARALADALGSGARGVAIDWTGPHFTEALRRHGVELLIHTAGPF